jgi:thiosulfate dehydrogenase
MLSRWCGSYHRQGADALARSRYGVLTLGVAALLLIGISACDDESTNVPDNPPEYDAADGINGGTMYDKFWTPETGWNQSDPNLTTFNAYGDFFRCKQCHGWDRKASEGAYIGRGPTATRPKVSPVNLIEHAEHHTPQELFDALWTSTGRRSVTADLSTYNPAGTAEQGDQMPDLTEIMTEEQVWDLVKFLKEEANDTDLLYDLSTTGTYPNGTATYSSIGAGGNAANGDATFAATCAGCHGADGRAILVDGEYTVGSFLRAKPYETQHKVKFGQPGTSMGSGLVTEIDDILDLYAALTDEVAYPDPAFELASGINGGTMYDKFWTSETGWDQNDTNLATFNAYPDFFRCKQCHAWDRLGNAASYIGRAPSATRPNVSSVNLKAATAAMSEQELFDALWTSSGRRSVAADLSTYNPVSNNTVGDQMPDLTEIMTEEQVWDLVKFLKEEANDTDLLYDYSTSGTYPTGSITYSNIGAGGNATTGDSIYGGACAVCHGNDGRAFLVDGSYSVGSFLRAKPYEVQHKVKFGQPGTTMGSGLVTNVDDILDLYLALTNATTYPDP